jgi:hypothetical protein
MGVPAQSRKEESASETSPLTLQIPLFLAPASEVWIVDPVRNPWHDLNPIIIA